MFKFVLGHSKAWLFYNRFLLCLKSVHNFTSKKPLDSVLLHLAVWHSPNSPVIICISSNKFDSPHLISSLLFLVFFKSFKVISLFSYQGSLFSVSRDSFYILPKLSAFVKNFFYLFFADRLICFPVARDSLSIISSDSTVVNTFFQFF